MVDDDATYLGHLMAGRDPGDIDDWVEQWHDRESDDGMGLADFLGFTEAEYRAWVFDPDSIDIIVALRRDPQDEGLRDDLKTRVDNATAQVATAIARATNRLN